MKTTCDWRTINDDRQKYAAYLCSREWAERREAVRERAGGKCERCHALAMNACHHLTYERKYCEHLDDLQAICNPCHAFTHGKSDFDPTQHLEWLRYVSVCHEKCIDPVHVVLAHFGPHRTECLRTEDGVKAKIWTALQAIQELRSAYCELMLTDGEGDIQLMAYNMEVVLSLIETVVTPSVVIWFLHDCPTIDEQLYSESISIVKKFGD